MKYAIISDIHANVSALRAVLADAGDCGVEKIICLGDVLGYGPEPVETLKLVYERVHVCLAGNHDDAVCGRGTVSEFNDFAAEAIANHRSQLNSEAISWLERLPYVWEEDGVCGVHGDFSAPVKFCYVEEPESAVPSFLVRSENLMFVGHTHEPRYFTLDEEGELNMFGAQDFELRPGLRYVVNPGSVGYPRTASGRSSYVIYDSARKTITYRTLPFDLEDYRLRMQKSGREEAAWMAAREKSAYVRKVRPAIEMGASVSVTPPEKPSPKSGQGQSQSLGRTRMVVRKATQVPKRSSARMATAASVARSDSSGSGFVWAILGALLLIVCCVVALQNGNGTSPEPANNRAKPVVELPVYDMSGISFTNATYVSGAEPRYLSISGLLPPGVTVSYENNGQTEVGEYIVYAHFKGDQAHRPIKSMYARLSITKPSTPGMPGLLDYDMSGVSFTNAIYECDGSYRSLAISGTLPEGVTVTYRNNAVRQEVGEYTVYADFGGDRKHNPIPSLSAKLTIVEKGSLVPDPPPKDPVEEDTRPAYDMSGITFKGTTFEQDGKPHAIFIEGALPTGVTVRYYEGNREASPHYALGEYTVTARFKGDKDHQPIPSMVATFNITIPGLPVPAPPEKDPDYLVINLGRRGKFQMEGFDEDLVKDGTIVVKGGMLQHGWTEKAGWPNEYKTDKLLLKRIDDLSDERAGVALYVGVFEITQAQWNNVMDLNPPQPGQGMLPMLGQSFVKVAGKCKNARTGISKGGFLEKFSGKLRYKSQNYGLSLPTLDEWLNASRARTTCAYYTGINKSDLAACAWFDENSAGAVHPVGCKVPNNFGLYDTLGNVQELTWSYYKKDKKGDVAGMEAGPYIEENSAATGLRVVVGGSYRSGYGQCDQGTAYDKRQARAWWGIPADDKESKECKKTYSETGFRVCLRKAFSEKVIPGPNPNIRFPPYAVIDLSGGKDAEVFPVVFCDRLPPPPRKEPDRYKTTHLVLRNIVSSGKRTVKIDDGIEISISTPMYAGIYEVTQRQWELVAGGKPSCNVGLNGAMNPTFPVENVTYNDIRGANEGSKWPQDTIVDDYSFMGILRAKTKLMGLDLPTESQWMVAAMGGKDIGDVEGEGAKGDNFCWHMYNAQGSTHSVGMKKANDYGLYDTLGNVWEWCLDCPAGLADLSGFNKKGAFCINGVGNRCRRGGGYRHDRGRCSASSRPPYGEHSLSPAKVEPDTGFRVFLTFY